MNALPRTPFETLQITNPVSRFLIFFSSWLAARFAFWDQPRRGAAGDLPEMTLLDNLYWVHKSREPIVQPEPELNREEFLSAPINWAAEKAADSKVVTLSFVGDILRSHRAVAEQDEVFGDVAELVFGADIAVANYESPVTDRPLVDEVIGDGGPPLECASPADFRALTSHKGRSFDVLNLANNHVFDMGAKGITATLAECASQEMMALGLCDLWGKNEPKVLSRNGIKFGFASCTYGTNGHARPKGSRYDVFRAKLCSPKAAADLTLLKRQIAEAKAAGCDFVIANLHWGHEFELFPRRAQQKAAQELADYGADLIVGHHPHVTQPVQMYRSAARGGQIIPIAYSLGSLLWGFSHDEIAKSTVLTVHVSKSGSGAVLSGLQATPVRRTASLKDGQMIQKVERL